MATSAKPRQPRLRASCDGCFLAKVKCSKARPICSRCLACGLECRYSPSSRAGKPKSDNSSVHHQGQSPADITDLSPIHDDKAMVFSTHPAAASLYKLETGWHTPTSLDGSMSRNPSIGTNLAMVGLDDRGRREHEAAMGMYGASMPWSPSATLSVAPYDEMAMAAAHLPPHQGRSASMDAAAMAGHMMPTWTDPAAAAAHEMMYGSPNSVPTPASVGSNYFPSPSATPTLQHRHKPGQANSATGSSSCTCFTVCLQSLQALHNASSPGAPPFDLVLSLNRKAVEGCAAMLACPRCMNRSGTHTSVMLLGTVIGKITSFYKCATQAYFETGTSSSNGAAMMPSQNGNGSQAAALGVSLGAYTLGGEEGRWLELQILERELRKLEEVYGQFRDMCAELSEDPEVSRAMIGYLNNTLGSTLDVVGHRKGEVRYA